MLALNLVGVSFARSVLIGIDMTRVRASIIRVIARDAKRLHQRFELQEDLILTRTKHIGQDLATPVINHMPKPTRLFVAPYKRPPLIDFRFISEPNHQRHRFRIEHIEHALIHAAP